MCSRDLLTKPFTFSPIRHIQRYIKCIDRWTDNQEVSSCRRQTEPLSCFTRGVIGLVFLALATKKWTFPPNSFFRKVCHSLIIFYSWLALWGKKFQFFCRKYYTSWTTFLFFSQRKSQETVSKRNSLSEKLPFYQKHNKWGNAKMSDISQRIFPLESLFERLPLFYLTFQIKGLPPFDQEICHETVAWRSDKSPAGLLRWRNRRKSRKSPRVSGEKLSNSMKELFWKAIQIVQEKRLANPEICLRQTFPLLKKRTVSWSFRMAHFWTAETVVSVFTVLDKRIKY